MVTNGDRGRLIENLLAAAAREGVYAILRFQERRERNVAVEGTRLEAVGAAHTSGLGAQVFTQGGHNGFAAVDDPDPERAGEALDRAVRAARAAEAGALATNRSVYDLSLTRGEAGAGEPRAFDGVGVGEMRDAVLSIAREVCGRAGEVKARTVFAVSHDEWRIARSDGTDVSFAIPRCQAAVGLVAKKGEEAARTQASATGRSYEPLVDREVREGLIERAVRAGGLARDLLDAPAWPAGSYRILIDYALAKGLAHEAFGHAAESDGLDASILGHEGVFRSGERFGGEGVSIVDESIEGDNAFQPFSGNGERRRRVAILSRGVLRECLADVHTAGRAGTPPTGAGRLASFACVPLPRMSNIRMEVADHVPLEEGRSFFDWTPEEIRDELVRTGDLSAGERVVFLSGYRGGQVNPALGDFVFHSTALYELTCEAVRLFRPGIFSGRIDAALHAVRRGFGPLKLDAAGTCGKAGQGVPSSGGSHFFVLLDEDPAIRIGGRS